MISRKKFVIVCVMLAATVLYVNLHADVMVPMNRPFGEFPIVVGNWRMISQADFDDQILAVLKPTDYLSRVYTTGDGRNAQLYIGYHGGGKEGGEIHSPRHCLPGSGWYEASSRRTELDVNGKKIRLVRAVYQKGTVKQLFFYWFQVQDRTLADEYSLKLAQIANSMTERRRDAAFIRIAIPVTSDEEQSTTLGMNFISEFYPVIAKYLPR
jgi:EpsI family protein